jgi:methylmalonyl-CoA mutase C-terminal domain/subunit
MSERIRVLLTKPTMDAHDRGVRYLARRFRDAGFEVIFTNFLVAAEVVATATQEGVDAIGVSSSCGGHMAVFEDLLRGLKDKGVEDTLVIAGGIISPTDVATLRTMGVREVYGPGDTADAAIELVKREVEARRANPTAP